MNALNYKKVRDILDIVFGFRQCTKCLAGRFSVFLALLTWLRNYKNFYFGSFSESDLMSEECSTLSRKWQISWKLFSALVNAKSVRMKFPEFLWHWLRHSEVRKFFIFEISLSLTCCGKNAPNYQENDRYMKNFFRLWTIPKVSRWRSLSVFGTADITKKL